MLIDGLPKGLAMLVLLGLGACQSPVGSFLSGRASPAGVPIAFESIEGAPATVQTALTNELATAASRRQIELAAADRPARYRVRGYLSTATSPEGQTAVAYVWDVFDADMRRAKRLTGSSPVRTASSDPWAELDKDTLRKLAAQSMDDIAEFLTASHRPSGSLAALADG